jgi:glutamyl-tRNA synthetase
MEAHGRPVRVRLAPSPTGPFHVGTARTALFNWLFAKKNGGVFVLRIEDTDPSRSDKKYEREIMDGLSWLSLNWDEGPVFDGEQADGGKPQDYLGDHGPYRQSERKEIYKKYLLRLLEEKKAYYCYCSKEELEAERQSLLSQGLPPKYIGHCRELTAPPAGRTPQVIRFRTPEARVEFKDIVRGNVSFDAALLGDIVIAKDLEAPLFNFAGAIDDELMEISHVIRGEDHISNTPKQILIQRALGFKELHYAHLPLLLAPNRSKLSKRFGETSLLEYRRNGYFPEALVNFLALLGWHPKDDKEIMSRGDLVKEFDLNRVQKGGAVFNEEKLLWLNKEYLKHLPAQRLVECIEPLLRESETEVPREMIERIAVVGRERAKTLKDLVESSRFFFSLPDYDSSLLTWQKNSLPKTKGIVDELLKIITDIGPDKFNRDIFSRHVEELALKEGRGSVFWPLRVALSGQAASPDPMQIVEALDYAEVKRRLGVAKDKIAKT